MARLREVEYCAKSALCGPLGPACAIGIAVETIRRARVGFRIHVIPGLVLSQQPTTAPARADVVELDGRTREEFPSLALGVALGDSLHVEKPVG